MSVTALTRPHEPNPGAIAALEHLLEQAKAGELQSFALAGACTGRTVIASVAYDERTSLYELVGVLESIKAKMLIEADPDIQEAIQEL